ncbi:CRP/FNR family transcriptional regulator, anaerobic regulatory protein [Chitinophaga sp. CF118]|uniref:Crp/Fnr family transcriptional regulator n=1 Tax=Chitinophaga sp. CF118 TaxID=1884367 RepID=UPI0008E9714F|nr:Crp/Fnr family transcriptional regulator [Chitinophaga sp. CF118]SFE02356.1 CRP/FNR family transcriptional regulator, anaerobic regulatory protein [Chitinophaga sp. CF118]
MKKDKHDCDLHTCMLCRLCIKEWLPAVKANRKNLTLKKGQLLFREGEPVNGIYFIYTGKVKVHKHWGEEKELIVRFAQAGDIVGHRGVGSEMVYPVSATALEPVTLCFIDLEFFQASVKVNHAFLYELMMFYARELQDSEKNTRNLVHMSVKGRIAHALLLLRNKFGCSEDGSINMTLSRQDLASYTGTTYETAFRVMSELIQENVIAVAGKTIAVNDVDRLQQLEKEAML